MKYLLTLLWLLGAIVAQAQEYTGHVADKEDGAPVAGAIVTARDSLGKPLGYTTTSGSGRAGTGQPRSSTSRRWATAGSRFRPTPGGCSCC